MQSDTRKPIAKVSFAPVVSKPIDAVDKATAVCADEAPDVTVVAIIKSLLPEEAGLRDVNEARFLWARITGLHSQSAFKTSMTMNLKAETRSFSEAWNWKPLSSVCSILVNDEMWHLHWL